MISFGWMLGAFTRPDAVVLICRARDLFANASRLVIIETLIHFISPSLSRYSAMRSCFFVLCVAPAFYVHPFYRAIRADFSTGVIELEVFRGKRGQRKWLQVLPCHITSLLLLHAASLPGSPSNNTYRNAELSPPSSAGLTGTSAPLPRRADIAARTSPGVG